MTAVARRPLLVVLTVVALSCGGRPAAAATVNGQTIPVSSVDRDLADIAANTPFLEARSRQGLPFRGTRPGTFDAFSVAALLNRSVTALLVRQELLRRRVAVGPSELGAAREALRAQVVDPANGTALLDRFPARYVDEQVRILAESDRLEADEAGLSLDEGALRAAYAAAPERYRTWCVRWILYGPGESEARARAAAAKAAVDAGADFAQVAVRESTDRASSSRGGALGCLTRDDLTRLGAPFRDAAVALAPGQVAAPATSEAGTFLVQATDVKVRPFDEVRLDVRAQVLAPASERYEQLLRRLRREATVVVSKRFGTWDRSDPDAITIVPPGGRPTTTTGPSTTLALGGLLPGAPAPPAPGGGGP